MSENENKTLQKRQAAAEKAAQQKKKYTWIKVVVGLCVVLCIVLTVLESSFLCRLLPAVKIGNDSYSVAEYNMMYTQSVNDVYNNLYSSLGDYAAYVLDTTKPLKDQQYSEDQTWADYMKDTTKETLTTVTALYNEGKENGYEMDETYTQQIDAAWESMKSASANAGYSANDYVAALYGKGVNEKVYKSMMEKYYYAFSYGVSYNDAIEITKDEMDAQYKENAKDYDRITYRSLFISGAASEGTDANAAMADAKAKAEAVMAAADKDAYVSEELDAEFLTHRFAAYTSATTEVADWVFDESRKAGDVEMIESDSGYYVVEYVEKGDLHYNTVSVRHVLVTPEDTEDEGAWKLAQEKAQGYMQTYKDLGESENNFANIAMAYSADGSSSNGGLYTNVYKGQMVEEFEDWCFDPARKPGDTDIIRTEYGYHLMYFVEEGEDFYEYLVGGTIRSEKYVTYVEGLMDGYTAEEGIGMPLTAKHFN